MQNNVNNNNELIKELKECRVFKDPRIEKALRYVDRADFVPDELRSVAHQNTVLPIGFGQTISQPYTVLFMLELLGVGEGDMVLDIGHGSGWQTALLAYLVGKHGKVHAIEIIPELCDLGKRNVAKYPVLFDRTEFECHDGAVGTVLPLRGKFDRVIAAADVSLLPSVWREELAIGGTIVYPSQGGIILERKLGNEQFSRREYPGFVFVPFVTLAHSR